MFHPPVEVPKFNSMNMEYLFAFPSCTYRWGTRVSDGSQTYIPPWEGIQN